MSQHWTNNSSLNTFKNTTLNNKENDFLFSTGFNVKAKSFTPQTSAFDPFSKQQGEDEEEIFNELNQQFISSNLLLEEDIKESEEEVESIPAVWDASPVTELKTIWDEPPVPRSTYSHLDDQEFDPTLHFYQGHLYNASTIQDMNRLSLNVPVEEEKNDVEQDMSTLQILQAIFSDLSEEELVETLDMYNYDADAAIEYLLNSKLGEAPVEEEPTVKKRQVCRHFLAGECYRKDCWFSHDLQDKICKFWLQGTCFKGDLCEFLHNLDVVQEVVANKIAVTHPTPHPSVPTVDDYPALPTAPKKKRQTLLDLNQTKKQPIQEEFPSLAAAAKIKVPTVNKKTVVNFAEMAKKKKGDPTLVTHKKSLPSSNKPFKYSLKKLSEPVQIPWLETGSSLNSVYMKEREKAIEYGTLRNRLFDKATEYYLKGDGARAKMYSMEAKHYNRLMQEMHKEASQRIFEQRSKHEAFIDLHGLHPDEAMSIIKERLNYLKSTYSGIIYIITGTGHHSGDNGLSKKQSKLKPVVLQYLKQHNFRFAETHMLGDNQGGLFAVEI